MFATKDCVCILHQKKNVPFHKDFSIQFTAFNRKIKCFVF